MLGEGSGGVSFSMVFSEEVLISLILLPSVVGGEKDICSSERLFSEVLFLLLLTLVRSAFGSTA